jgi:hypothetical protein
VKSPCERACEPTKARTNVPAVSRVINDRKDSRERALIVCLGGQEAKGTCASRMLAVQPAIMRRPDGSSSGCTTYDEERNLVRARYSSIYMLVSRSATTRHPLIDRDMWQSILLYLPQGSIQDQPQLTPHLGECSTQQEHCLLHFHAGQGAFFK